MTVVVDKPVRRELLVSRWWVQGAALVVAVGFFGLVLMGFMTYQSSPPIPDRLVSDSGAQVFSGADVHAGQDVLLKNGLMEHGSIFGHGAFLGPDFTADYLCTEQPPSCVTPTVVLLETRPSDARARTSRSTGTTPAPRR